MRNIQYQDTVINNLHDTGYHFAISPTGTVYEGRGWQPRASLEAGRNQVTYSFAYIGQLAPNTAMVNAMQRLIACGRTRGALSATSTQGSGGSDNYADYPQAPNNGQQQVVQPNPNPNPQQQGGLRPQQGSNYYDYYDYGTVRPGGGGIGGGVGGGSNYYYDYGTVRPGGVVRAPGIRPANGVNGNTGTGGNVAGVSGPVRSPRLVRCGPGWQGVPAAQRRFCLG